MKLTLFATLIILGSCNANNESSTISNTNTDTLKTTSATTIVEQKVEIKDTLPPLKVYANKRFKDVLVERIGKDSFLIHGRGQIFEASFNWVLEDGHDEFKKGFQMTDAGAPEWGKRSLLRRLQRQILTVL